ncbi:MAG: fructose bisphosphate aldolase [Marinovum algicola]|jgi:fructose-bisphosphate aldolase class I|uniref:fructose-bisphosphate aldolase n=1 Tax=Marinovum algicola TaxID=42444 RepID=A0A975WAE2_9RHOB|nr:MULTISPECIES: fructose bisphosphate aldolase [Marinovum]MDD9740268.1 fructose bisphosphate aldolase [Marinovum sp. SP66]MDD9742385.1 fructose bisphosphate aldolase [Marinovum sp. PR37]SEJ55582.1 fructose-bisphosphate aldolase, class I [Marinovum algicola]SLN50964.1 Fructose-bisphosphate aldolase class 1 [Marinovum algicola]
MSNDAMAKQMANKDGFIAALDQSGGSTPKALRLYGIEEDAYSGDEEMYGLIHEMRARIIKSPAFSGDKVIGAILFERTMDGDIDGTPTAEYLWDTCGVVPFLKVDKGLCEPTDGVKLMKAIPGLDALCARAVGKGIYGTKMRSVIDAANPAGITAIVSQQFEFGREIKANGLMPILEPEVTITIDDKAEAEAILRDEILKHLDKLPEGEQIMLKLSLPSEDNFYKPLIDHPKVMRVVALSGGYSRDEANTLLARNEGLIASFSRGLTEGLSAQQSDEDFNAKLGDAIDSIYQASKAG